MRSYRYAISIVPSGSVAAALTASSLCSFPWYFLSHFESPFPNFLFFKKFFYFSPPLPCFVNRLGNTTKWRSFECHSYHPPSTLINLQTLPPNPHTEASGGDQRNTEPPILRRRNSKVRLLGLKFQLSHLRSLSSVPVSSPTKWAHYLSMPP